MKAEVDAYIAQFEGLVKERLTELRSIIQKSAPQAEEVISYKMPAYKHNGMLVYFAGYKQHIGFYPTASPIAHFADDLSRYKTSKGAVQFPLDKPLPKQLIVRMVKFKLEENQRKLDLKKK
jgi:uncharacterized protein YdhG (YjbR/CyaY superfamily)